MKPVCCMLLVAFSLLGAGSFEVASIKPSIPDEAGISGEDGRNGLLKMRDVSLKRCIGYNFTTKRGRSPAIDSGKVSADVLVVDHVELPTDN